MNDYVSGLLCGSARGSALNNKDNKRGTNKNKSITKSNRWGHAGLVFAGGDALCSHLHVCVFARVFV